MKRWIVLGVIVLAVIVFGFSLIDASAPNELQASAVIGAGGTTANADLTGFARADSPRDWEFPRDFGAHPEFQTEWWYYTGSLTASDGHRFGYQFTLFRRALTPTAVSDDPSEWRTNQVYMVHFAVSDIDGAQFYHEERFGRGAADLAGAVVEPQYRTWLEDWQVIGLDEAASQRQITAQMSSGVSIDFTVQQIKPPALQGANLDGVSAKGADPGNASYYYSLTRMPTTGTVTVNGQAYTIDGLTWMDHEFSTSALDAQAQGWDWFGLHFDDGRDVMIGQIRYADGARSPYFGGLLVDADGGEHYLPSEAITITPTGTWTSPHTGGVYPAGWQVTIDAGGAETLHFTVSPLLADQELNGGGIAYWEGAVSLSGDVTGRGYAELTGYATSMTGRF